MKRHQMEAMIWDPEGLAKLTRMVQDLRPTVGEIGKGSAAPVSLVMPAEHRTHDDRPTVDRRQAKHVDFAVTSGVNFGIARFLSADRGSDSVTALRLASKACATKPSDANLLFLELAINALTSERALDDKQERAVEDAIKIVISADQENAKGSDG